jgi:two-component system OmpR family response regulator
MRILVAEDDARLAHQIVDVLRLAGYVAEVAADGEEALFLGETEPYDAVVLDLGLPELDGLAVLERWRGADIKTPVLVLTARGTWQEKVTGLRAGADDYLAKPFEMEEMLARLEALVRRASAHASPLLDCGPVTLDTVTHRVTLSGRPIDMTALEYRMLAYMMHHKGKVISKTELTEHIYGQDFDRDSNTIEVLINRLRNKLGAELIKTHRGLGYQLVSAEDAP